MSHLSHYYSIRSCFPEIPHVFGKSSCLKFCCQILSTGSSAGKVCWHHEIKISPLKKPHIPSQIPTWVLSKPDLAVCHYKKWWMFLIILRFQVSDWFFIVPILSLESFTQHKYLYYTMAYVCLHIGGKYVIAEEQSIKLSYHIKSSKKTVGSNRLALFFIVYLYNIIACITSKPTTESRHQGI